MRMWKFSSQRDSRDNTHFVLVNEDRRISPSLPHINSVWGYCFVLSLTGSFHNLHWDKSEY